jgi:hypothetical protein
MEEISKPTSVGAEVRGAKMRCEGPAFEGAGPKVRARGREVETSLVNRDDVGA